MSNEDEFFVEMHPQIAQVIGIAVMQLLVEKREPISVSATRYTPLLDLRLSH